jgi:GcrA cell cycle regulator
MTASNWSDNRIEQLKSLWQEGLSASQVARAMGDVTRNAVLGKLHRLGLLAGSQASRPSRPRVSNPRCRSPRASKAAIPIPVAEPDAFTFEDGSFATVVTVNDRMCRWPIGDPKHCEFHFCGQARKPGSCYCEAHAQRAHKPATPRSSNKAVPREVGAVLPPPAARHGL